MRFVKRLGSLGLTVLAVAGALSAVTALFCLIFGYSIILFSTGSMHPTIPRGSLAVVKSIAASDVKVGDIVTVDRGPGRAPVTHRVVESTHGQTPSERTLLLKGDANKTPDAESHTVTQVRKNVFSIPGAAQPFLLIFDNTAWTVCAFGGVGALIVWRFWPTRGGRHAHRRPQPAPPTELVELEALLDEPDDGCRPSSGRLHHE